LVDTEFKFIFTKMDILSYLTNLLKTEKEVGIEGLGTFFKKKTPGRYDAENHIFIPPSLSLLFTIELKEKTNLCKYIVDHHNISEESARYYIGLFVEDINRQLAISNEADLDSLGTLYEVNDNLVLKEERAANLGSDFYGLPEIHVKNSSEPAPTSSDYQLPNAEVVSHSQIEETDSLDLNDDQVVYDEISETPSVKVPEIKIEIETAESLIQEDPEEYELSVTESNQSLNNHSSSIQNNNSLGSPEPVDTKTGNIWHFDKDKSNSLGNQSESDSLEQVPAGISAWVKIAITLVLLCLISAVTLYYFKPALFGIKHNPAAPELQSNTKTTFKPITTDTIPKVDSTLIKNSVSNIDTNAKDSATSSAVPINVLDSTTWEIIGASLTKREVNRYIRDMKSRGYSAKPVPNMPGSRRIKMSIATFKDEESAKAGRRLLVQKLKNKDLYIYQNKHTKKPL
jgi:nucleoid DNA-binding protein